MTCIAHSNRTGACQSGHRYEAPDNGGDTVAVYSTLGRFEAQLPVPFDIRFTPGSHHSRFASIRVDDVYSFRSSLLRLFD